MTIHQLCKMEDPVLRTKTKQIVDFDDDLGELLEDMIETMIHLDGFGLAAPQIGKGVAVSIIRLDKSSPALELINPRILQGLGEEVYVENCLSLPGYFGKVKRSTQVTISYQDRTGKAHQLKASGFLARAIQHELDHHQGLLFVDRLMEQI